MILCRRIIFDDAELADIIEVVILYDKDFGVSLIIPMEVQGININRN